MANLSLGLLALGWWIYSCVMQEGDKARNWRSRWRQIWVGAVWMACLFHWTSYLLRWYIGGRIPLGNGHETMLFLAGFLLLCMAATVLVFASNRFIAFWFYLAGSLSE